MRATVDRLRTARLHDRLHDFLGDETTIRLQRAVGPVARRNLTGLAMVYWSDKAGQHRYTDHYARHLCHLRRRPMRLLEIGIGGFESPTWGGASLRMWRDYFRLGEIHGVDIHEKRIREPRIHVHRGDQSDPAFMGDLGRRHGPFDVIVDDGSHINSHVRASFSALFDSHLKPGGFYVIEDLACAYDPSYGGGAPGHAGTSAELIKGLVDAVTLDPRQIAAIHVYLEIAFIQKGAG